MKTAPFISIIIFNLLIFLFSCQQKNTNLVSSKYVDSLLSINTLSSREKALELDMKFWKNRYESDKTSETNTQKYAGMLTARFHLYGNIADLKLAENLIQKIYKNQKIKESGLARSLANYSGLQHRFNEASALANKALEIGDNKYESLLLQFDSAFELGKIDQAKILLHNIKKEYEYAYYFRLSKMNHYDGDLEKAIQSMEKAALLSHGNIYLEQAAISNLADLQLHSGDYEQASLNFQKSIALDHADYHSIKGIGIIAQNHDKNFQLAQKLYDFVAKKTASPDIYFNLIQLAQSVDNKDFEIKYAKEFTQKASEPIYGNMYNKYLIELSEGVLANPKTMLEIAEKEVKNRNTPQTNSWLAWALYKNNRKAEAMAIYQKKVNEKPLEGLELYFMGKMMAAEKKLQNAQAYFKAAFKNKFELMPNKIVELETELNS
jgi:tetratricopeptide (TPR) repeat protein